MFILFWQTIFKFHCVFFIIIENRLRQPIFYWQWNYHKNYFHFNAKCDFSATKLQNERFFLHFFIFLIMTFNLRQKMFVRFAHKTVKHFWFEIAGPRESLSGPVLRERDSTSSRCRTLQTRNDEAPRQGRTDGSWDEETQQGEGTGQYLTAIKWIVWFVLDNFNYRISYFWMLLLSVYLKISLRNDTGHEF